MIIDGLHTDNAIRQDIVRILDAPIYLDAADAIFQPRLARYQGKRSVSVSPVAISDERVADTAPRQDNVRILGAAPGRYRFDTRRQAPRILPKLRGRARTPSATISRRAAVPVAAPAMR
jgi:hypothetical protein